MFKTTAAVAILANLAQANSTPIYGSYPGYTVGQGRWLADSVIRNIAMTCILYPH